MNLLNKETNRLGKAAILFIIQIGIKLIRDKELIGWLIIFKKLMMRDIVHDKEFLK